MAATGVIFVEQKVLLQFAEIQHLTQLDANKQILLLVQLFNCVKSFEVYIKDPEAIPKQSVIKDFFSKLCTVIACQQDDAFTEPTDKIVTKTEPLTEDVSDNDYTEPVEDLPEYGLLDNSVVKDELNTIAVSSSSWTTPSSTSVKPELSMDIASTLNDTIIAISNHESALISSLALSTDTSSTVAASQVGLTDLSACTSAAAVNSTDEDTADTKLFYTETKTLVSGVRRSARHTRLPVKLNSEEFIGLQDAAAKPVKQAAAAAKLAEHVGTKSAKQSTTKAVKQLTTKAAKQSTTKELKQRALKSTKQTLVKTKHTVVKTGQDVSVSPEKAKKAPAQQTREGKAAPKSLKQGPEASSRRAAQKSLKSVRKRVGRPVKHKKAATLEGLAEGAPVEKQPKISSTETKSSKAELFAEQNTDNSIQKGENTDTTELQYICAVCNLRFEDISKYVDHVTLHPTPTTDELNCKECGLRLKTKSALIQHQRSHVAKTISDVSCPTCGKVFLKKKYLKPHMLRHQGDKNVLCDSCPARFYDRKGLYVHYNRVHLGKIRNMEAKFFCSYCSFKSYRKRDLDRHSVVHTKMKNYVCDICGVRLAHFTSLSIHKRLHSGTKPFKCDICQKEFSQKISLQNHERIHTGERPYKCDQCSRGFQTSSHLSRHKITHSQELLFQCKFCDKWFARPFQVKKHVKENHSDPDLESDALTYEYIKVEADPEDVSFQDELVCDSDIQYESIVIEYID
ncbi:zinc finger protein 354B-like isoform X1 [Gigantopelta aegis]|uniref:zinc finger protein 354B-like isoform X1 n=1 Tax=Gigantopelta aegis TaxID=1735272 RepID=UPI001B889BFD|nr:zinc finger protein 354B-like isoform X1 [Gigantopelta aegis]